MITVQAYRVAIGAFLGKARKLTTDHCQIRSRNDCNARFKTLYDNSGTVCFLRMLMLVAFIVIVTCNLNLACFKYIKLMRDGDIESNPGPTYSCVKVINGSFHQGDPRFGITAGTQCACNSLFSICWSTIRRTALWNKLDLDFILIKGDAIYKCLNVNGHLSFDDLPRIVDIDSDTFNIHMLRNETGLLNEVIQHNFLYSTLNESENGDGLIFITEGYTFSILWSKRNYFLFDPHSRDDLGAFSDNGSSVLLKFSAVRQLQNYIFDIYFPLRHSDSLHYQIQYVHIVKQDDDSIPKGTTKLNQSNTLKSNNYTEFTDLLKSRNALYRNSEEHNQIKKLKREKWSVYKNNISDEQLEARKQRDRECNEAFRTCIADTELHEEIKKQKREQWSVYKDNISDEQLEAQKLRDRDRKAIDFVKISGTPKHDEIKQNKHASYVRRKLCKTDRIQQFRTLIQEGPNYVCVCCQRGHYKSSVVVYNPLKCVVTVESYTKLIQTIDGKHYICKTCQSKLKKGKTPCQAVWNRLELDDLPDDLAKLHTLEKAIICKRILFRKVLMMPKGQMPKIKGAICNIPIDVAQINKVLPAGSDSNGLISVKLKRKLCYNGHVYFEPVRPEAVKSALQYLKLNNNLYHDIVIAIDDIPSELLSHPDETSELNECEYIEKANENIEEASENIEEANDENVEEANDENIEEQESPLDKMRVASNETLLISHIPCVQDEENVTIAPGEGQKPLSILSDEYCEELAFPYLLPRGRFGFTRERKIPLSASKYFNQRLLHYTQRFASSSDYIFFAHSVIQQKQLNSNINIAMKKVQTKNLTAGMLSENFESTVKSFIAKDEGYSFMNTIKGTPAYWKRFLFEVLGMVKQLGLPTFFMTLSCADLRWNELVSIISKLNGIILSDEEIDNLSYFERCKILNMNPVVVAKNFQYRVEVFFKEIIIDGPLGKVKYYAIRIEFQFRGSPHIHSFLWVLNAPTLTKETKEEYIQFVDRIVKAHIPDPLERPELHDLVKTYQLHSHSKSCRKYKNKACRYSFGKFFTARTIVAEPLPNEMSVEEKSRKLSQRLGRS